MKAPFHALFAALLLLLPLAPAAAAEPPPQLDWEALVPPDWHPEGEVNALMDKYKVDELSDDDPRAAELQAEIDAIWNAAPVVKSLDGKRLRLPGFVVPLRGESEEAMREFLLVPYYGACIHVPPPPANQTVHVVIKGGKGYSGKAFDTVMVTGTLKVEHSRSKLAEAGYRLDAEGVEHYRK